MEDGETVSFDFSVRNPHQFYEKLKALYIPTGLPLAFDFCEANVNLYLLYKEVTDWGGYQQNNEPSGVAVVPIGPLPSGALVLSSYDHDKTVCEDDKWNDIASALDLDTGSHELLLQLCSLYGTLLLKFEQIHFYRQPVKLATSGISTDVMSSSAKRTRDSSLCSGDNFSSEDNPNGTRKRSNKSNQFVTETKVEEQNPALPTQSKSMTIGRKKKPRAVVRWRSAYAIFLKKECARLKELQGKDTCGQKVRKIADNKWSCMPDDDRMPYIEESMKDKQRYDKEMIAYKQSNSSSRCDGAENESLSLLPHAENTLEVDKAAVAVDTGSLRHAQPDGSLACTRAEQD